MVKTVSIDPEAIARHKDMKIVYTPIHGTGMMLIPRALKMWGFENVYTVPEQMIKDGNFPTVVSPNPENAEALTMALNLAKEIDADLVMASDPDADRVGIACKDDKGEWVLINGNQTCLMYLYYIITQYNKLGKMTGNEFCVKTIVTTELIKKIADKNQIEMLDCYTGFKWIAREIRLREGKKKYIGGGEESYGFLAEDFVRDKDAVIASMLICEMAAYYRSIGSSLKQRQEEIYAEYGRYLNKVASFEFPGLSGMDKMAGIMDGLRKQPLTEIAGSAVVKVTDYEKPEETGLPSANVLIYKLANGETVIVRPSGTEPKIKVYYTTLGKDLAEAEAEKEKLAEALKPILALRK